MKLIVQPDAGMAPIVTAIKQAKKSIDILIFRLDRLEIARALAAAVPRGVRVRALTAHVNRGGTKFLRKLEMHLLEAGVTVSRTADDLIRYHGKMMIIDGRLLHVYGFNFTAFDMEKSRSFGIVSKNPQLVSEASKLFAADFDRQPYVSSNERLIVSPDNSRDRLAAFLKGARKELLIYDPKATDDAMLRIIEDRLAAGVDVKIIGKVEAKWDKLPCQKYPGRRLHVRAIVRDGRRAFVGSQSLRRIELDKRRELGVMVNDQAAVNEMREVFLSDWARTYAGKKEAKKAEKEGRKEEKLLAAAS
jgi:phosphatidylserine/phosphatidylglycerophosphate/cardiolipin synthase-like enzyme